MLLLVLPKVNAGEKDCPTVRGVVLSKLGVNVGLFESVSEASARVGVSKVAIYKRIKRGDLRCMRCYGVVIVEKGEVDALYNGARKEGVEV